MRKRLRLQQLDRSADQPRGAAPACDFQDAFRIGLHDVFVTDPDNRIIFHGDPPSCPAPEEIQYATDRSAGKITACRLANRALTGLNSDDYLAVRSAAVRNPAEKNCIKTGRSSRHGST